MLFALRAIGRQGVMLVRRRGTSLTGGTSLKVPGTKERVVDMGRNELICQIFKS